MQSVVLIREDNHGVIGIAETYRDAILFLIKEKWLTPDMDMSFADFDKDRTPLLCFGEEWDYEIASWEDVDVFNAWFEGSFYLSYEDVYREEKE